MRTALRRTVMCMRIFGLTAVGALVAHLAAVGLGDSERGGTGRGSASASEAVREPAEAEKAAKEADAKRTPLPAAVLTTDRTVRLAEKGMTAGSPVMIRIFKAESQLELWMQKDGRFELFATYSICRWSGTLGPKLHEGDRQAPEGIYSVSMPQIHRKGRWRRAFNIGYPNAFDKALARTGSLILVHGGCTSTGCFAMTDAVMDEIYKLSEQALSSGQDRIPVHVFPFRMTEDNLKAHAGSEWQPFWRNIKEAYDVFERTRLPPAISVCSKKYVVNEGLPEGDVRAADVAFSIAADRADCVYTDADASSRAVSDDEDDQIKAVKVRRVASKAQRQGAKGRNVRKNYAEARKTRMAAARSRAKHASARRDDD